MHEPFHNYDPYDHICTINLKLDELINQHNALAQHVSVLEQDNRLLRHRLGQLIEQNKLLVHKLKLDKLNQK